MNILVSPVQTLITNLQKQEEVGISVLSHYHYPNMLLSPLIMKEQRNRIGGPGEGGKPLAINALRDSVHPIQFHGKHNFSIGLVHPVI